MRKPAVLCLCFALSLLAGRHLYAQNYVYATGSTPFTTEIPIENGYIAVNNGEIHMEIPLVAGTQRGSIPLNESLVYDSRIWKIVDYGSYSWQPTNVADSMGGWRLSAGLTDPPTYSGYYTEYGSCGEGQEEYPTQEFFESFAWTDPQGTSHAFDTVFYQQLPLLPCAPNPEPNFASGYALDGSGYFMTATYDLNTEGVDTVIYDKHGNEVYPAIQDTNGNYMSTDSNGDMIDTLGRTPVETGTSGNQITYSVLTAGGTRVSYVATTETVYYNTAFEETDVSDESGSFTALQSIQLPDGSSYSFTYDSGTSAGHYGEITSVTLPTGGVIDYTWQNYEDSFKDENRWLSTRVENGGTTTFQPDTISYCSGSSGCQEQTTVTDPDGNDTVYAFDLDPGNYATASSWNTGIIAYQGTGAERAALKSVITGYQYNTTYVTGPEGSAIYYAVPSTQTVLTSLPDVGLTSQTVTTFDSIGANPVSVQQWDYYSGSTPPAPVEQAAYTYSNNYVNGASVPTEVSVTDGSGNLVSQTAYGYDQTTPGATSGLPQHASVSGPRGNLTTVSRTIDGSGSALTTTMTYDDAGALLTSTDPDGQTSFARDPTDTYVTTETPPTPSSGVSLPQSASYDASTGLRLSSTDPNGETTTYSGYDWAGRAGQVGYPDGGTESLSYPSSTQAVDARTMNPSTTAQTQTLLDGYGRLSRVAVYNGQAGNPWYQTDSCYGADGRLAFKSYPYQGPGWSQGPVCSGAGDTYHYDALGRLSQLVHGDGSERTYQYKGRATEAIDENGVDRITQVDALGRITAVCEMSSDASMPGSGSPGNCGLDLPGTGFLTTYSYNLANHTTTVSEGAQTRVFQTDMLGRSISVEEPESGTTTYSYAYNGTGLVVTRKRPRANQTNPNVLTTTTTQYDAVGRVVSVSYDDGLTPTKSFTYDTAVGWWNLNLGASKGRLTFAQASGAGIMFAYDPMGRVSTTDQCLPGWCGNGNYDKWTPYSYDWMGNVTSAGDGAGVTASYAYSPAGEVTSITSSLNDSTHPPDLVSNVQNGPNGPTSYELGNGLGVAQLYDGLGRLVGYYVCVGSTQVNCAGGTSTPYNYWISESGQRVIVRCSGSDPCVDYGYDEFNRLTEMNNYDSGQQLYTYVYDRYGNRWQQNALQGGWSSNLSFNTANNQVDTSGYTYDAAGNLTSDGAHSYTYDAEGNLLQVDGGSTASYEYNALNQRVRIDEGGNAEGFLYNTSGRRLSVWNLNEGNEMRGDTYWGSLPVEFNYDNQANYPHEDWRGAVLGYTSYNGTVEAQSNSLPFGDGSGATGSDFNPWVFAQMDKDYYGGSDSGTDHAQYRQYADGQGRWFSPDPYSGSYDLSNPQSMNRYSYVMNNPLSFTDPTGQFTEGPALYIGASVCGPICAAIGFGIGALADALGLDALFGGGPSFHGSLAPRPQAADPASLGESLGIPSNIPQGNWGLGLPDPGCEFGACGGSSNSLTPGQASAAAPIMIPPQWIFGIMALFSQQKSDPYPKRLFGTHWCGPGGAGPTVNGLDAACKAHDLCYDANGFNSFSNWSPYLSPLLSQSQEQALQQCNQALCNAASQSNDPGSTRVQLYFTSVSAGACIP